MRNYDAIIAFARQLLPDERLQLIDALWETVSLEVMPPLSEEWRAEVARRSDEFDAGSVQPVSWEQVRAESMQRLNAV